MKLKQYFIYSTVFLLGFWLHYLVTLPKDKQCDKLLFQVKKMLIIEDANKLIIEGNYTKETLIDSMEKLRTVADEQSKIKIDKMLGELNGH